jgi:hypothetical protein
MLADNYKTWLYQSENQVPLSSLNTTVPHVSKIKEQKNIENEKQIIS